MVLFYTRNTKSILNESSNKQSKNDIRNAKGRKGQDELFRFQSLLFFVLISDFLCFGSYVTIKRFLLEMYI